MKLPVFDLHCDTAFAMLDRDFRQSKELGKNDCHIDLDRAGELGGYAQCFACFTTPLEVIPRGRLSVEDVFEREMNAVLSQIEKNRDRIVLAHSPDDIQRNLDGGKMSAILTIEGPAGIGYDPGRLEALYQTGFRMSTLTWNERNPLAGSHATGGGLTDQGKEYVKEAQRLGMLIDVSHLSDEAFRDLMDMTQAPILASHSNSRAVCGHSRNLTDDMFRAIAETGGVAGINLYADFLGEKDVTLDTVCDHIFHFLELDPDGEHIALGGDLDGCDTLPQGFTGINSYNALADVMLRRGLDEKTIRKIYWHNAMGVIDRAVHHNQI